MVHCTVLHVPCFTVPHHTVPFVPLLWRKQSLTFVNESALVLSLRTPQLLLVLPLGFLLSSLNHYNELLKRRSSSERRRALRALCESGRSPGEATPCPIGSSFDSSSGSGRSVSVSSNRARPGCGGGGGTWVDGGGGRSGGVRVGVGRIGGGGGGGIGEVGQKVDPSLGGGDTSGRGWPECTLLLRRTARPVSDRNPLQTRR